MLRGKVRAGVTGMLTLARNRQEGSHFARDRLRYDNVCAVSLTSMFKTGTGAAR